VSQENHKNHPFSEYTGILQCNILSQFTSAFSTPNLLLSEKYSVMQLLKHTPVRKVTVSRQNRFLQSISPSLTILLPELPNARAAALLLQALAVGVDSTWSAFADLAACQYRPSATLCLRKKKGASK